MPAKYSVQITQTAKNDVADIWSFIAHDSPTDASKFIAELEKQATTLEKFPERCPLIPESEFLDVPYRHLLYQKYRTIFRIAGRKVYVLRIVHGSKLLEPKSLSS